MSTPESADRAAGQAPPVCYRHPDRVTYVRCTRCDRPICGEDQITAAVGFHCPDDVREGNRGLRTRRTAFGGVLRPGADVTRVLLGLNVAVFLVTAAYGLVLFGANASPVYEHLPVQAVALAYPDGVTGGVADGQVWRLLTAVFVHYGLLHLVVNMVALLQLGPALEQALGRTRFLGLYLLSGLGGSTASYAFGPLDGASAGASGALYGLAGAWLLLTRRRGQDSGPVVAFLVVNLLLSYYVPGIDLRGHIGGLLTGAAVGAALFTPGPGPRRTLLQASGAAAVAVVLVVVVAGRTVQLHADGQALGSTWNLPVAAVGAAPTAYGPVAGVTTGEPGTGTPAQPRPVL